ncbi:MAG: vitamin K epoxide reductase family protein [Pyrinomonadaceae bacterium]
MAEQINAADAEPRAAVPTPSAALDIVAALLALVGLGDAVYLTVEHLTGATLQCSITHGCAEVLGSPYATVGGLPLAAFGAAAYFTVFSLSTLAAFGYAWARSIVAPLVALMFLFTLWLLYLQAFVLHAFCQYCLLSATVTTLLTLTVVARRLTNRRA